MEVKHYISTLKRWAWLLILGLVLGAGGGYAYSSSETPVYQTTTRVLVMAAPGGTSDTSYLYEYQLAQTYMQLLTTTPILDGAAAYLGHEVSANQISVRQSQNTQIMEITVEDSEPQRAVNIANTLVTVLLEESEELQVGRYTLMEESLAAQIAQMEERITGLQSQIETTSTESVQEQLRDIEAQMAPLQEEASTIKQELATLQPATSQTRKKRVAELEAQLAPIQPLLDLYQQIYTNLVVLGVPSEVDSSGKSYLQKTQTTLELFQQIYVNLLNSMESIRLARLQNTPNVVQIEAAFTPTAPIRPKPLNTTMLAGAIGLSLMLGTVFLIEYLDDTLKTPDDIQRYLGLPVIGYIAEMKVSDKSPEALYVARQPRSPVTEAFRALRTNLEFAGINQPLHTLLVTSSGPHEGKTSISTNLAGIIAQGDRNVVIIDADMRRPRVHRFLSLPNQMGLSDLFRGTLDLASVKRLVDEKGTMQAITSGNLPPNPAELLGSTRMDQILEEVSADADMVIIDSPPSLVADATILAAKVDGVVLVIEPGKTERAPAIAALEQLQRADARVVGVILNRIPRNRADYYGGHQHYASYYKGYNYYSDDKVA